MSEIFNLVSIPFGWKARGVKVCDYYNSMHMLHFQTLGFGFTYNQTKPQISYDMELGSLLIRPPAALHGYCVVNDLRSYRHGDWPIDLYPLDPGNIVVTKEVNRFTARDVTSLNHTSYLIVDLFMDDAQMKTKYLYLKPYARKVSK